MYEIEKRITLPKSCSAVNNALTLHVAGEGNIWLAYPHRGDIVVAKLNDTGAETKLVTRDAKPSRHIVQVGWARIGRVCYLVVCSLMSVDFYDQCVSVLLHTHTLTSQQLGEVVCARGIASFANKICLGCSDGSLLVFDSDHGAEGDIYLCQRSREHVPAVVAVASGGGGGARGDSDKWLASGDESGAIVVWQSSNSDIVAVHRIDGFNWPCTCLSVCGGVLVAGYGDGMLRVFQASDGCLRADAGAHCGWISSLDAAPETDSHRVLAVTVGEDGHVRAWRVCPSFSAAAPLIHRFTAVEKDCRLMGVIFTKEGAASFAVSAYDRNFINIYSM